MMNTKIYSLTLAGIMLCSVVFLSSCVKDDLYCTAHPEQGAIKVTTDWNERSSESVLPSNYIIRINGEEQTVQNETNTFKSLFSPGQQTVLIYNQADGITINNNIASVNTLSDGTLNQNPGYLFSATKNVDVVKDDTANVTINMLQRIRTLKFVLSLNAGDEQRIASTSATLTGIASSMDISTGSITSAESKTITPLFSLTTISSTRTTTYIALTANIRVLGVATAEKQQLSIAVTMTNGTTQAITTDITDLVKKFNDGDVEPLILNATITLSSDAAIKATISDWNPVDNENITMQ